jgi:hypothetical protein
MPPRPPQLMPRFPNQETVNFVRTPSSVGTAGQSPRFIFTSPSSQPLQQQATHYVQYTPTGQGQHTIAVQQGTTEGFQRMVRERSLCDSFHRVHNIDNLFASQYITISHLSKKSLRRNEFYITEHDMAHYIAIKLNIKFVFQCRFFSSANELFMTVSSSLIDIYSCLLSFSLKVQFINICSSLLNIINHHLSSVLIIIQ